MKRDVNKILLFLTITPIILFLSFSTYYNNKLKNITIESYKQTLQESTGKTILNINETTQLRETFQKDKEALEHAHFELKSENEELKREKDILQSELDSAKSELEEQKVNFDKLNAQFQQVQNSLIKTNEEIGRLAARVRDLCSKVKASSPSEEC